MIIYRYSVKFGRSKIRNIHYSAEFKRDSAKLRIEVLARLRTAMAHDIPDDEGDNGGRAGAWCQFVDSRGSIKILAWYKAVTTSRYQMGELQGAWGAPKTAEWVKVEV